MKILTTIEAAEILRQKPSTLENWRSQKKGPKYYKPLGTVFYMEDDLTAWMKSDGVEANNESQENADQ